ncbi:hypothetical protein SLA2020_030560 [Shorea laevis]
MGVATGHSQPLLQWDLGSKSNRRSFTPKTSTKINRHLIEVIRSFTSKDTDDLDSFLGVPDVLQVSVLLNRSEKFSKFNASVAEYFPV